MLEEHVNLNVAYRRAEELNAKVGYRAYVTTGSADGWAVRRSGIWTPDFKRWRRAFYTAIGAQP